MRTVFENFYREYLGMEHGKLRDGILICKSGNRDLPLNKKFYYKLIAAVFQNRKIVSCSGDFSDEQIAKICDMLPFDEIREGNPKNMAALGQRIQNMFPETEKILPACMYRMLQCDRTEARSVKKPDLPEVQYIYLPKYRKYVAAAGEDLLGYCKISDVFPAGADLSGGEGAGMFFGNLVIWVDESYRRKGLAYYLLDLMIRQCREEKIEPLYFVKAENEASIKLAQKSGFQIVQTEFVITEVTDR